MCPAHLVTIQFLASYTVLCTLLQSQTFTLVVQKYKFLNEGEKIYIYTFLL